MSEEGIMKESLWTAVCFGAFVFRPAFNFRVKDDELIIAPADTKPENIAIDDDQEWPSYTAVANNLSAWANMSIRRQGTSLISLSESEFVPMSRMMWFIITGVSENFGNSFRDRIVPAAETWLKSATDGSVYAIMANTNETRDILGKQGCSLKGETMYTCRTKGATVTAVLANCSVDLGHPSHGGDGPCCKYDHAIQYVAKNNLAANKDWFYIADDDLYLRLPAMQRLLALVDPKRKLVVNADGLPGQTWGHTWNKAIQACNKDIPQGFFFNLMSAGIMHDLMQEAPDRGVSRICKNTCASYDTTVGLLAWVHGASFLPARQYRVHYDVHFEAQRKVFSQKLENFVFVHGVRFPSCFKKWDLTMDKLPFSTPENWTAEFLGRNYAGSSDACHVMLQSESSSLFAPEDSLTRCKQAESSLTALTVQALDLGHP